jgi:hypothetical protein
MSGRALTARQTEEGAAAIADTFAAAFSVARCRGEEARSASKAPWSKIQLPRLPRELPTEHFKGEHVRT